MENTEYQELIENAMKLLKDVELKCNFGVNFDAIRQVFVSEFSKNSVTLNSIDNIQYKLDEITLDYFTNGKISASEFNQLEAELSTVKSIIEHALCAEIESTINSYKDDDYSFDDLNEFNNDDFAWMQGSYPLPKPIVGNQFIETLKVIDMADYVESCGGKYFPPTYSPTYSSNSYSYNSWIPKIEEKDYYILAYGSLLNVRSRSRTIPEVKGEWAVVVDGYERCFDVGGGGGSVLNVKPKAGSKINAVLLKVSHEHMTKLYNREMQYDAVKISPSKISLYQADDYDGTQELDLPEDALMFVAKGYSHALPGMSYLQACIYGSSRFGIKFVNQFVDTTSLANGTKLGNWMNSYFTKTELNTFVEKDSTY